MVTVRVPSSSWRSVASPSVTFQPACQKFFPIVMWLQPMEGGLRASPSSFVGSPFNVLGRNRPSSEVLRTWPDELGLILPVPSFLYPTKKWHNDPHWFKGSKESGHSYVGAQNLRRTVALLLQRKHVRARKNLFAFESIDEIDCNARTYGAWLDSLDSLAAIRRYVHDRLPWTNVIQNLCPRDAPYTQFFGDVLPYLENVDIVSRTANLPLAYPGRDGRPPELPQVGPRLRRSRSLSRSIAGGDSVPHLAYGYGRSEWGGYWRDPKDLAVALLRGRGDRSRCRLPEQLERAENACGPPKPRDAIRKQLAGCYLLDAMSHELRVARPELKEADLSETPMRERLALWASIPSTSNLDGVLAYLNKPYNLQRFLVFHQIVNGAVGVWFYSGWNTDLVNELHAHQYDQVYALAEELARYRDVLSEEEFFGDWTVSDPRVEILMKRNEEKLYLFAASTHHEDLVGVRISVGDRYPVAQVTALNEVVNGDFAHPFDRRIECPPDGCNSFTDDFVGEGAGPRAGTRSHPDPARRGGSYASCLASPGYGVHVYELLLDGDASRRGEHPARDETGGR